MRRDALRRLAGSRYLLVESMAEARRAPNEFWTVLNEIPIVYADDKNVPAAVEQFARNVKDGFKAEHLAKSHAGYGEGPPRFQLGHLMMTFS